MKEKERRRLQVLLLVSLVFYSRMNVASFLRSLFIPLFPRCSSSSPFLLSFFFLSLSFWWRRKVSRLDLSRRHPKERDTGSSPSFPALSKEEEFRDQINGPNTRKEVKRGFTSSFQSLPSLSCLPSLVFLLFSVKEVRRRREGRTGNWLSFYHRRFLWMLHRMLIPLPSFSFLHRFLLSVFFQELTEATVCRFHSSHEVWTETKRQGK